MENFELLWFIAIFALLGVVWNALLRKKNNEQR